MWVIVNGELRHCDEETLQHYGVLGMKWGVHKAGRKAAKNERLKTKAIEYDRKAASLTKKSEKAHAKIDLVAVNKAATKAAVMKRKAASLEEKAQSAPNEFKRAKLEAKAATAKYKSAKAQVDANRLSKTTGYGVKAMKYSIESDKATKRAAKVRMKIAKNERYIAAMNRKISSLSEEDLRGTYAFVNEILKN